MTISYTQNLADLVIKNAGKINAELKEFIKIFYGRIGFNNAVEYDYKALLNNAKASLEFFKTRQQGSAKIEVVRESKSPKAKTILRIINDDCPFLVDSVTAEINRKGLQILELIHPVISTTRDSAGRLKKLSGEHDESYIVLTVSPLYDGLTAKDMEQDLAHVLKTVKQAVIDWKPMVGKTSESIVDLEKAKNKTQAKEAQEFLRWLIDNHFTFLGAADFKIKRKGGLPELVKGSQLGVLKPSVYSEAEDEFLPQELKDFAKSDEILEITKSQHKAIVHRDVYMDQVGIKKFDVDGNVVGERWFVGLFASSVYYQATDNIPLIRNKVKNILSTSGFERGGHSSKIIKFVLDSYPRDEIFQSTEAELHNNVLGILDLVERPRVGLFIRKDKFNRFISCLCFVPKERFDTNLRKTIQDILEDNFNGEVTEYYTQITDSPLSRLHIILQVSEKNCKAINADIITQTEKQISAAATVWSDELYDELVDSFGEEQASELYAKYAHAFPEGYQAIYNPSRACFDIVKIEESFDSRSLAVELFQTKQSLGSTSFHLKTFNPGKQMPLSQILPVLENMGLHVIAEQPFFIKATKDKRGRWIRDFRVKIANNSTPKLENIKPIFEEAVRQVYTGYIESDGFNRLVLYAGLTWQEVVLIRAIAKYIKQINVPYSVQFMADAICNHPKIAKAIIELFYARFTPNGKNGKATEDANKTLNKLLSKVSNLNEDRAIRKFIDVINAVLRTNYFQPDKNYVSLKVDSAKVPDLPLPHPFVEVFVYSPKVEGIHLRGGKVARGGLRWSDRHEDFRTEILGLMKAQMVKNSVIVPVGSKGGFVVKQPPKDGTRDDYINEGIECYKTFLRGILDVTDNYVGEKVIHPKQVKRHDGKDPYLVVAADKGTAKFSDIANSVSADYGFWLDDAFASGGSVGYDHKAMGITAKGAWVSVQRHFRELGHDTQSQDFTCVGIGDMMGDVFGNGMLLSKHIRLVGAFNHMHIFLDPTPNAAKSYKERERMFNLPRSSWEDYDTKLISKGGGVYSRSEKSIKITKEVQDALGIKAKELTPDALIRAMLKAPVDLLWNGGIGTYVKAVDEDNSDVGDKANDNLRINGNELRCKVIGEGGNLGFTQLGRIEYALNGGMVNTDAIDNSAGVDCSDHEVNIKIALAKAVENKQLTMPKRNKLLESMTDNVSDLVLRDNYLQTQALSIAQARGTELLEPQSSFIEALENKGLLNREVEFLPNKEQFNRRIANGKPLTRPELSVILAYAKITLFDEIVASNLPDDEYFAKDLALYFPTAMRKKYADVINNHRLRREIIATFVTNSMVNRTGATFFYNVARDTGMAACDIARAYTIARDTFGLRDIWQQIEALDLQVSSDVQYQMFIATTKFIERITFWFLRNQAQPLNVGQMVDKFSKYIEEFKKVTPNIITKTLQASKDKRIKKYVNSKVPAKLADSVASLEILTSSCDVSLLAHKNNLPIKVIGKIYFTLGAELSLGWLRVSAQDIATHDYWTKLSIRNIIDVLYDEQRRLTDQLINSCKDCDLVKDTDAIIAKWLKDNDKEIERHLAFIKQLKSADNVDQSMLFASLRRVENLCSVS